MKLLLQYWILLICSILVGGNAIAATYTSKSSTSPGYRFEENASWTSGSIPGTYNGSTFTVSDGTTININGYVALNGNLSWANDAFLSSSTLNVKKNSILVIDGNFDLSDRVDVILEDNATLYIKGNLVTHNNAALLSYCDFQIGKFANVVVEGNVSSASDASVCIYRANGNADFYIFGTTTGNVYKKNHSYDIFDKGDGSSYLEDEQDYNDKEEALIQTVSTISENLFDCTLRIPDNKVVYVNSEVTVCAIEMGGVNSSLIITEHGKLNLSSDITINTGIITNYGQITSTNNLTVIPRDANGRAACQFYNNGAISVRNFNLGARGNNNEANTHNFNFTCGSSISATESIDFVVLGWTGQLNLLGNYSAESMTIDYESGGDIVNFGDDCGDSQVSLSSLTLIAGVSVVNVHEITGLEHLILNTNSAVKMSVDGILTIGDISQNNNQGFGIDGNESSVIRLCFNPTSGQDYGLNGATNTTKGTVYYRWDDGADRASTWYGSGETDPYHRPSDERDVTCDGCRQVANKVSFDDCMAGVSNFLPIELVSFTFDKSRNEFVWTTASETGNDFFVIEYSKNGNDWIECTEYVHSLSNNGYTYRVEPITSITESLFSYFRLKQVDFNGEYSYSDVLAVSFTIENPCSKDFEETKMQIRELGNKWYRVVNGELIYCENDN